MIRLSVRRVLSKNSSVYAIFFAVLLATTNSVAGCLWTGATSSSDRFGPILFGPTGLKILANKKWFNDLRYPEGSLMGIDSLTLSGRYCSGLPNYAGIEVVYAAPANAVQIPSGFRIPSDAPGVAFEIVFPGGVSHPDGILVASTPSAVSSNGILNLPAARAMSINLTISLVKAGSFGGGINNSSNLIRLRGGLGWFSYVNAGNRAVQASRINQLVLPERYGDNGLDNNLGYASTPGCELVSLGNMPLLSGTKSVTLPSVSNSAFSGPGSIDAGSDSRRFAFSCQGTSETKPKVYFDADVPFNLGVNGVGLPEVGSDVGVQVLLDDVPVIFGARSTELEWNRNAFPNLTITPTFDAPGISVISPNGRYCLDNCGVDMSGSNWHDGGAAIGNNNGFNPYVTFKYYQTTTATPAPRTFSVPFTITLDVP